MTNATITLKRNPISNNLESGISYTINGSGFPAAPTVGIFKDWAYRAVGELTTAAGEGSFSALYGATAASSYPKIQQLGTVNGIAHHNETDTLVGHTYKFGEVSSFFTAWQMGVSDGKLASGSYVDEQFSAVSSLKMNWWNRVDGANDPIYPDVVCASRNSQSTFTTVGNQTNYQTVYPDSGFDWDVANSFMCYQKAGADPFLDDGAVASYLSRSTGTTYTHRTNVKVFAQVVHLTPTVASLTAYTVNVLTFSPIVFTSDADATLLEILNGIISQVNLLQTTYTASLNFNNTKVKLTPNSPVNQTVTASGNITVEITPSAYDRLSTIWMGNENQTNTQSIYPYLYVAHGANCGNVLVLTDNATFGSSHKTIAIKANSWSSTNIVTERISKSLSNGLTHWHILTNGLPTHSGALA